MCGNSNQKLNTKRAANCSSADRASRKVYSICFRSTSDIRTIIDEQTSITGASNLCGLLCELVQHSRAEVLLSQLQEIDPRCDRRFD
jgi:hypothetical protein